MRRGLIRWDPEELPLEILRERMRRLRSAMADTGCDAMILYTNFIRCAAVSWLTGFSPYWADGILVIAAGQEPYFATSLSKRMGQWIETVMPGAAVITSPNPGQVAGTRLAQSGVSRVGVLELNDLPSGLYTELSAALAPSSFVDASHAFARARFPADQAEKRLLRRASDIADDAFDQVESARPRTAGEAAAAVEKSARMDGAEEIYVAVASDLDQSRRLIRRFGEIALGRRYALRATVAYKGNWVRRIRTCSRDPAEHAELRQADAWFGELLRTIGENFPGDVIMDNMSQLEGASLESWFAEAPSGTRPLSVIAAGETRGALPIPSLLTLNLALSGMPWCGAGLAAQE